MAVYSVLLAAGLVPSDSAVIVYTAPASGVVVVRDLVVTSQTVAAGLLSFMVVSGSVWTPIYKVRVSDNFITYQWQGRQVLEPGDEIQVATSDGGVRYRISGYLLGV